MRTLTVTLLALALLHSASAQDYIANRFAGGVLTDGTPGLQARLGTARAIAVDRSGNVYIADTGHRTVLRLDNQGILTRVAGTGAGWTGNNLKPYAGDGGPATGGQLTDPEGVAVDADGNIYISDLGIHCIRKVSIGVITTTVILSGPPPGPHPAALALDTGGALYIEDWAYQRIFKVVNGMATPVAGNGTQGFSGDGGPATSAQLNLNGSNGIAVDAQGNLYIADQLNQRIRKVSDGVITTFAGGGSGGDGPATDAYLNSPVGVAVDAAGNVYIADSSFIRKVANGVITTVAGGGVFDEDGPATSVYISPTSLAADAAGSIYFFDSRGRLRKLSNGMVTAVAGIGVPTDPETAIGASLSPAGIAVDPTGGVFIGDGDRIRKITHGTISTVAGGGSGSGDGPAIGALVSATGVAVDANGNLYIANGTRVSRVSNGVMSTVAGGDTAGYSGDGGPPTSARLNGANTLALGPGGELFIGDAGNNCIRKISGGVITTVAGNGTAGDNGDGGPATSAELRQPAGIAVDGTGTLYIADGNNRVRKVSKGIINAVAGRSNGWGFTGDGGPAVSALLNVPRAVAVDVAGNLYIADSSNHRIRKVANGIIATIAGSGEIGPAGDGGPALQAMLNQPVGLAIDGIGNIYVSDLGDNRVVILMPAAVQTNPRIGSATSAANGNITALQSNSWVTIWGSNLAPATSGRTWQAQDIIGGELPVSLDGVSVTVEGKAAFVEYISRTQINILAPDVSQAGPVNIQVTSDGLTSAAFSGQIQAYAPAFFTFSPPNQSYAAAVFAAANPDGSAVYVAPDDVFGPGASRPARAGEVIELYGTGFGPTDPKAPAGHIFYGAFPTMARIGVTIGGIEAQVSFSGLILAGLYQLNVKVPAGLPDGDLQVVAAVAGFESQNGVFIPVRQ